MIMQSVSFKCVWISTYCYIVLSSISLLLLFVGAARKGSINKISSNDIVTVDGDNSSGGLQICETELCAQLSSRFRTMGKLEELDPCQDFYKFACGGFGGSTKKWAQEIVLSRLGDILREAFDDSNIDQANDDSSSSLKRMNSLYKSCMNREIGYEPLVRILREIGGFPLLANLTSWLANGPHENRSWFDLLLQMSPLGLDHNHFFSLTIGIDPKNTSSILISLGDLKFAEPDIEFVDNHLRTLTEIEATTLDRDLTVHQLVEVKSFQQRLYNISIGSNEKFKSRRMTLDELKQLAPRTDWLRFVRYIFEADSINANEQIVVTNELFISELDEYLWKTDTKTLVNYVFLNIINDLKPELTLTALDTDSMKDDCRQKVSRELPFDLSSEYIRRFVDAQTRNRVYSIGRYVQREIKFALDQSVDWIITERTKLKAKEKLDNMLLQVGYTNELINASRLDSMFNGILRFDENDYLANLLKLTSARRVHEATYLHKVYRSLAWEIMSKTFQVNAMYQPFQNVISIFAGQLTEAHYHSSRPQYMNYGSIGTTIGHELGHAFGLNCAIRNQCWTNRMTEVWWDEQTGLEFAKRARCIQSRYDGLELAGTNQPFELNGTETLEENLADMVGYTLAYRAYTRWLKDNYKRAKGSRDVTSGELRLPNMEQFDERQLFWLTLANRRCDYDSADRQARKFRGNTHSPEVFRVNIPLQNMKEFSRDFNCETGSPMNPSDEKCMLW